MGARPWPVLGAVAALACGCAALTGIGDLQVVDDGGGSPGADSASGHDGDGTHNDGGAVDVADASGTIDGHDGHVTMDGGGITEGGGADSSEGASASDASDGEAAADAGAVVVDCPSAPCAAGQVCCAEPANGGLLLQCETAPCANRVGPVACTSPAGCGQGAPYCCGTFVLGPPVGLFCTVASATTSCTAACVTNIAPTCTQTDTPRLCATPADCEPQHPLCCGYGLGQFTENTCLNAMEQNLLAATCM
jgi:hypothetical protein